MHPALANVRWPGSDGGIITLRPSKRDCCRNGSGQVDVVFVGHSCVAQAAHERRAGASHVVAAQWLAPRRRAPCIRFPGHLGLCSLALERPSCFSQVFAGLLVCPVSSIVGERSTHSSARAVHYVPRSLRLLPASCSSQVKPLNRARTRSGGSRPRS